MNINLKTVTSGLAMAVLAASTNIALAGGGDKQDENYCMDVVIDPFHMLPDMQPMGSCTVRDYWDGQLQQKFYPFTDEEHLFNCEYFGPVTPLPSGDMVPSAVISDGNIVGTIGGHAFEASLACASLTNWYQDSCADPTDPMSCSFQLAQPFQGMGLPFPRVTEVSIFDGVINVDKDGTTKEIPIVMATRAAGITHLENLDPSATQVGASITHSLLGMASYNANENNDGARGIKLLSGSADMLLQGHIFYPTPVAQDPGPAVIRGSICSKKLYKMLNQ
jgi:hypothetical protein